MATFGAIGEYSEHTEQWATYTDPLSEYFAANEIENATRKRAILNSVVGATTYKLISDLLSPQKPNEATFSEIVELLKLHFVPAKSVIVCRFTFHKRHRLTQECIGDYLAALRAIAQDCGFGDTLNERLRDQLVIGVNYIRIQNSLLTQGDTMDFKKAKELAQSMELAAAHAKVLAGEKAMTASPTRDVDAIRCKQKQPRSNPQRQQQSERDRRTVSTRSHNRPRPRSPSPSGDNRNLCANCELQHYVPGKCPAQNKECYKCLKLGHFASCCRSTRKSSVSVTQSQRSRPRQVHLLDTPYYQSDDDEFESYDTDVKSQYDDDDAG
jgi:hypothetical protein